MRAGIFGTTDYPTEAAIAEGLAALGLAVEFQRPGVWRTDQARPYDVVVVRGFKRDGDGAAMGSRTIAAFYADRDATVLIHDMPAIRKPGYFAFWNGAVNRLPETFDSSRLGMVDLRERKSLGKTILVCGQVPNDSAHGMNRETLSAYFGALVTKLGESYPECKIVFRPHPHHALNLYWVEQQDPFEVPFEDALADPDLFAVATYNSTCGVASLEAGVPVLCDPSSFYAHLSGYPTPPGRREFFARLTYAQWTLDELRTPGPFLINLPARMAA